MLDWNLKATWDSAYSAGIQTSQGVFMLPGYWRYLQREAVSGAKRKAAGLANRLNNGPADSICIVGGGFGYLAEEAALLFPGNAIVTVDTSAYVQAAKGATETADLIAAIAGLDLNHLIGAGAEILSLLDLGVTKSQVEVLDADIATAAGAEACRDAVGLKGNQQFDFILSDDVLPTLSDAEAVTLSTAMRDLGRVVVHLVTPGFADGSDKAGGAREDLDYNWHSLAEWRALVGPDRVASLVDFQEGA